MPSPIDAAKRQPPLCPRCRFELVATIAANKRVCPKCGLQFTLDQLTRDRSPDQWSEWTGLRHAAISLLWKSLLCLPAWAALVWLMLPLLAQMPFSVPLLAVVGLVLCVPGVAIGQVLASGLTERAGFAGPVPAVLGGIFAVVVVVGGVELAEAFRSVSGWQNNYLKMTVCVAAVLWAVKLTIWDE